MTETSPFWAALKRPPPRFLDRATSVGIEEHRRAPSPEIKAKRVWWFMWFTVINPMFPGWYQWILVQILYNLLLIKHIVVVLVVFSSTLVHFVYLLLFCLYDDHLRSWQSALSKQGIQPIPRPAHQNQAPTEKRMVSACQILPYT